MNKVLLVFKNELISVVARRSFILTLVLIPLGSFLILTIIGGLGKDSTSPVAQIFSAAPAQVYEGYIDQAGIVKSLPAGLPGGRFTAYTSIAQARADLQAGKITGYYVVPSDYLATGKLTYVRGDYNPLAGMGELNTFEWALQYNLLGQDNALLKRFTQPVKLEKVSLSPEPERDSNNMLAFFLPYIVTMLFYIVILSSSGLMLNSVTSEKQNRVIEILMSSVTPTQMLTGKIVGLGLAGLLQTVVWSGAGYLLLRFSGQSLNIPAAFQLPPSILGWGVVFFIFGYAFYATLMAGVGALVPSLREASQASWIMILPMMIPIILLGALTQDPNGGLALGLSLFPLTAPVAMMARLASVSVPFWQPALAAVLLAASAALAVRAVAGMFRAQTLLSGEAFNFRRFFSALVGREG